MHNINDKRVFTEMEGEDTAHIVFKVVRKGNKNQFDTYTCKYVPIFDDVKELREYLLSNFKDELSPAADANAFRLGYVGSKNRKLTICSEVHLAEAYSNSKDGWVTLWVDPHETSKAKASSTGSKRSFAQFMAFDASTSEAGMLNAKFET